MFEYLKYLFPDASINLIAILNFLIYLFLAIFIKYVVIKLLSKLVGKSKNTVDDNVFELLKNPIVETILILGAYTSLKYIDYYPKFTFYIVKSLATVLVLIWTILIFRLSNLIIRNIIRENAKHTLINYNNLPLIVNMNKVFLILIGIIVILSTWELDLTPLLASAGILSVIIGFAAKDTLANFLGGISVIIDKPYRIGDWIELDSKERGEVVDIGLRSTRMRTRDDILIAIPNSIISNAKIINESFPFQNYRIRIPVSVHYNADLDLVESELTKLAENNDKVLNDPFPRLRFREFGSSTINCELLCWTNQPADRGLIIHLLLKEIYLKFNELGIEFPYQQIDVKIKNMVQNNDKE